MRWDYSKSENVESSVLDRKLRLLIELMRELGISIGHEDGHGSFIIYPVDESNYKWLMEAGCDMGEESK